jgi:hypothetical protein
MADPVTMLGAGTAISAGSTLLGGFFGASAAEDQARLQQAGAEFEAKQLEQAAGESRAASQRQMFERQRLTKLALSNLRARAGAGGDAATSGDVLRLTEDIAGRGEYQALSELYTGENRARGLELNAAAKRYEGKAKVYGADRAGFATRAGSVLSSGGTLLTGLGSSKVAAAKLYG